jgi:hypothetical protein
MLWHPIMHQVEGAGFDPRSGEGMKYVEVVFEEGESHSAGAWLR